MDASLYRRRRRRNWVAMSFSSLAATLVGLGWLVLILGVLLWEGFSGLSLKVFTEMTPPPGADGGLLNPIAGSLIMTGLAVLIGTPVGILAGHLHGRIRPLCAHDIGRALHQRHPAQCAIDHRRTFIYEVMVAPMGHFSAWAGAVALAVIVVPVVIRTTEDMLLLVPNPLREAAAALGLPRAYVIRHVAYRAAKTGIVTGVLLAVARISGETAPLLFTALNNQFWSSNLNAPMASLPAVIFQFALSPYADWQKLAWTGALDHHTRSFDAQHRCPRGNSIEKAVMNVAMVSAPQVDRVASDKAKLRERISIRKLDFYYGDGRALKAISLPLFDRKVTAFIGPSGCGKSTLLRVLNRMYDLYPNQRAEGEVLFDGANILSPKQDRNLLRARIGMVFQKPTPFPMTIYDNIAFGIRLYERLSKSEVDGRVEQSLKRAGLWNEVKDKLQANGLSLSGGQQQRLCIARTVAVRPEVILLDEPCSALDPISTAKIEELIEELKADYTIVIVTHNMQQAARVSEFTAFMYLGELIEFGDTQKIFTTPNDLRTQDYITGRFG